MRLTAGSAELHRWGEEGSSSGVLTVPFNSSMDRRTTCAPRDAPAWRHAAHPRVVNGKVTPWCIIDLWRPRPGDSERYDGSIPVELHPALPKVSIGVERRGEQRAPSGSAGIWVSMRSTC